VTLDLATIALALIAGIFGILSPCVWPLVPVVTSSAAISGRTGPLYLALGLSVSFALAGTLLTLLLVSTGLDPELFRYLAAVLLVTVGVVLLVPALNARASFALSRITARSGVGAANSRPASAPGQFGVGALLGFVWLPCVGPTLGAAIALAAMGQDLAASFVVMLAYGVGTAGILVLAGWASGELFARWRARAISAGGFGRKLLGASLLILGLLVLTGLDKRLEALAVSIVPEWVYTL
jgi:cytochrome c-type biogenesis protein